MVCNIDMRTMVTGMRFVSIIANVPIWDYNPADSSRTKYGESTNVTTGSAAQTNYNFKINNPAFNNSVSHKVVAYVNVTTPTTGSKWRRR
jgi:hypothetical protein